MALSSQMQNPNQVMCTQEKSLLWGIQMERQVSFHFSRLYDFNDFFQISLTVLLPFLNITPSKGDFVKQNILASGFYTRINMTPLSAFIEIKLSIEEKIILLAV